MAPSELYDIYGLRHQPFWHRSSFFLALFFCCFLICWYLFRWYKNKKKMIVLLLHEQAFARLNDPIMTEYLNAGLSEPFYQQLIMVLKWYLSQRYALSLASSTDTEMLVCIGQTNAIPPTLFTALTEIFDGATVARFAQQHIAQEQMMRDLSRALLIIKESMTTASNNNAQLGIT